MGREEFVQYRQAFYPLNVAEKSELGAAWEHHKQVNMHHHESWVGTKFTDPNEWVVHCVHMIIDWTAMSYRFGDTAQAYYESGRARVELPEYAEDFIYEIFNNIKEVKDGEG